MDCCLHDCMVERELESAGTDAQQGGYVVKHLDLKVLHINRVTRDAKAMQQLEVCVSYLNGLLSL